MTIVVELCNCVVASLPMLLLSGGVLMNHEHVPNGGVRAVPLLVLMLSLAMTMGPINDAEHVAVPWVAMLVGVGVVLNAALAWLEVVELSVLWDSAVLLGDGETIAWPAVGLLGGSVTVNHEPSSNNGLMRMVPVFVAMGLLAWTIGPANGMEHWAWPWVANVVGVGEVLVVAIAMLWLALGVLMNSAV